MDNIIHLNALVIKETKEPVSDKEVSLLTNKIVDLLKAEGYDMYGKGQRTSAEAQREMDE